MNSKIIIILLSFLFPTLISAQSSVISYNIRYDNSNDGENWWEHRKKDISNTLKYYSPLVIGIQEGLHHQVTYLDSVLSNYNYTGVGRDDGASKGEYAAIFYDTTKMSLVSSDTYWLSDTPELISVGWDASMERIVTFASFINLANDDTLFIFNCHFDHIGELSRKNSAKLVLQIIEDKMLQDKKLIVMGDLNCEPSEAPIRIFESMLEDNYDRDNVYTYGPVGTFNQFKTDIIIEKRIDYVLTKNIEVTHYVHIDDRRKNNLLLSDHLPVMIKF